MKKSLTFVSAALTLAVSFSFASCTSAKKLKEVPAADSEATYAEYRIKFLSALGNVRYAKDYQKTALKITSDETASEVVSMEDGDYAWTEKEGRLALDAKANKRKVTEKILDGEEPKETNTLTESYINEEGTFMKIADDESEEKFFSKRGSIQDFALSVTPGDVFNFAYIAFGGSLSDIFPFADYLDSLITAPTVYAYADSSGSGFRMQYNTAFDVDAAEGADSFVLHARLEGSVSVFFDKTGNIKYAETIIDGSASFVFDDSTASLDFKCYQKTSVQVSSTVKFPADLESYKN